jgi:hypothetical protein
MKGELEMTRTLLAVTMAGLAASSAQAAFVSFASDNDHTSWTFRGNRAGVGVMDAQDPNDPMTLLVDDQNGPLPALSFPASEFTADFTIAHLATTALGGGSFVFVYALDGLFSVGDLSATVSNGTLTVLGGQTAAGGFFWGSTATIQGNDQGGSSVTYTWNGLPFPGYDLPFTGGTSDGPDDAAFTLTVLHAVSAQFAGPGGQGIVLGPNNLPAGEWLSEGSFSGQLRVPGPGALAMVGLAGLAAGRRRR